MDNKHILRDMYGNRLDDNSLDKHVHHACSYKVTIGTMKIFKRWINTLQPWLRDSNSYWQNENEREREIKLTAAATFKTALGITIKIFKR